MLHRTIIYFVFSFICGLSVSCNHNDKAYAVEWSDNNLFITMSPPAMSTITPGLIDWHGVDLSDVMNEIHYKLLSTNHSGTVAVKIRFAIPQTDKYGNESLSFQDYLIASIPISEAKKFKSGKYLDSEYCISDGIKRAALEPSPYNNEGLNYLGLKQETLSNGTKVYLQPGDSLPQSNKTDTTTVQQTNQLDSIDLTIPAKTIQYQQSDETTRQLKALGTFRKSRKNGNNNQK